MGLDAIAGLIVAGFDLAAVRAVTGAIRAADANSGRGHAITAIGPAPNVGPGFRRHLSPEPVYEPRRHIHPTPTYEPRRVIRPAPHYSPPVNGVTPLPAPVELPPMNLCSPIQPPWKMLPRPVENVTRVVVKTEVRLVDIAHRGAMLDLFI